MKIYSALFNTFACFPFVSIINLAMFYILFFYLENYFKLNLNYFYLALPIFTHFLNHFFNYFFFNYFDTN